MRIRLTILLVLCLLADGVRAAHVAAAELGTAPHFLKLADRERIVLFSDGPVAGALADQRGDGSVVVTVPKVGAGAAIAGREFDDAGSGGSGATKVRVTTDAQGDARIEITSASRIGRVHAYATTKPARLMIDLLQEGAPAERAAATAKAEPAPAKEKVVAMGPATAAATAQAQVASAAAAPVKIEPAPTAPGKPEQHPAPAQAQDPHAPAQHATAAPLPLAPPQDAHAPTPLASGAPSGAAPAARDATNDQHALPSGAEQPAPHGAATAATVAAHAPAAAGDAEPMVEDDTRDRLVVAAAPEPAQSPVPAPTATPPTSAKDRKGKKGKATAAAAVDNAAPAAGALAQAPQGKPSDPIHALQGAAAVAAGTVPVAGAQVVPVAAAPAPTAPRTLLCRWRRIGGVPYCGPDPKAGIYAADLGTAEVAGLLDRARSGPRLAPLPNHGPAEAHLNADVALLRAAKTGYLLPALGEYEHALRSYPGFADADRSRANVALIYHTLGFAPELVRLSRGKNDPVAPFAGVLLADLWRDREDRHDLAPLIAAGRDAGGITRCLAERVAANVAADEKRGDAFPAAFAELSKVCPRTILEDSETAWLRGRAMLLGGEATRAAETLPPLEDDLPRRERALLLADVVAAQDAAGDAKAARRTEERLAGGTLGRRAARNARLALAERDAAEGKLGDLSGRFADLPMEDALVTRARADAIAVGELLRANNEIAALGMMTERKVEARSLAPADQLLLVRALRKVGLLDQARRVLAGIGAATTGRLPDAYYEEMGALALAHDDAPGALDVVEQWRTARGSNVPAGAIALKARARAAKGDARGATEALEKELVPLDPVLARDVAVELAGQLRSADPASALRLAQAALAESALPPLEPAREAAALSALADAAEATGDTAAARVAFARLAQEFASEPAAAGAAYRAARLASATPQKGQPGATGAAPATQQAANAPAAAPIVDDDPLSRRLAAAGALYAEVVAGMQGNKP